jgi:predicted DNA-binding transcriptional regulator YafY
MLSAAGSDALRRAERLFQLIQILRGARRPVTAEQMARELETSKRTVYRDIAELLAQRVPIQGEAGIGYVLDRGFDMPPLMLTPDEIEAAVLGARWVMARGDPALSRAARDLIAKIGAVIPDHLQPFLLESALTTSEQPAALMADAIDMGLLREAIRGQRKVGLVYRDEAGVQTERTIWPIAVGYYDAVRLIAGWCELRDGFRNFRTDRVVAADFTDTRYPGRRSQLMHRWRTEMRAGPLPAIERDS